MTLKRNHLATENGNSLHFDKPIRQLTLGLAIGWQTEVQSAVVRYQQ